jgi:hypothetical protein
MTVDLGIDLKKKLRWARDSYLEIRKRWAKEQESCAQEGMAVPDEIRKMREWQVEQADFRWRDLRREAQDKLGRAIPADPALSMEGEKMMPVEEDKGP